MLGTTRLQLQLQLPGQVGTATGELGLRDFCEMLLGRQKVVGQSVVSRQPKLMGVLFLKKRCYRNNFGNVPPSDKACCNSSSRYIYIYRFDKLSRRLQNCPKK